MNPMRSVMFSSFYTGVAGYISAAKRWLIDSPGDVVRMLNVVFGDVRAGFIPTPASGYGVRDLWPPGLPLSVAGRATRPLRSSASGLAGPNLCGLFFSGGGQKGRNRFYNESRTLASPYKSTPGVRHRQLTPRAALQGAERVADPMLNE